ncbi:hypothetical protein BZA05DRAFT_420311 [Tricharina praecox]|uniref:uncharacterized protein n=1 Tax=Tricharina praecox TaxID=43433 RepID=UPI00221F7504|nr:uncharacterized protein BZA05DRAFT_420311 [Tricharina praecox]KAI5848002.1 hypothetical protein BZA05DRAFT_420311 [Tricharina praecox]
MTNSGPLAVEITFEGVVGGFFLHLRQQPLQNAKLANSSGQFRISRNNYVYTRWSGETTTRTTHAAPRRPSRDSVRYYYTGTIVTAQSRSERRSVNRMVAMEPQIYHLVGEWSSGDSFGDRVPVPKFELPVAGAWQWPLPKNRPPSVFLVDCLQLGEVEDFASLQSFNKPFSPVAAPIHRLEIQTGLNCAIEKVPLYLMQLAVEIQAFHRSTGGYADAVQTTPCATLQADSCLLWPLK